MSRTIVDTIDKYVAAIDAIGRAQLRVVDTETTGLVFHRDYIVGVCVLVLGESYYFPFRHFAGENLDDALLPELGALLHAPVNARGEPTQLLGFNYQYDAKMWHSEGIDLPAVWDDPILMAHLCNENEQSFKMETLAEKYVNREAGLDECVLLDAIRSRFPKSPEKGLKGLLCYLPESIVGPYGMQDVETTLDLYSFFVPWLKWQGLHALYKEQRYYAREITRMEIRGIALDLDRVGENSRGSVEEAARLKAALSSMAGKPVNPGSPVQMGALLGMRSTQRDLLEESPGVPNQRIKGAAELLAWRQYSKAETAYYEPFRQQVSKAGRIHTSLRIVGGWQGDDTGGGTVTGRLSAQHPNLQAVKRGTGLRYSVRDVFVADPGCRFVEADYSQAELRLAAHYCKIESMADLFRRGVDIHAGVAAELSIPRNVAKNVNFSFLYGIGPDTFAAKYHYTIAEACAYLGAYNDRYPEIARTRAIAEECARKQGHIEMWTGRRRHYNTKDANPKDALNAVIQGGVGEMVRHSITAIGSNAELAEQGACMVLTVHDSILFLVPDSDEYERAFIAIVRGIMEPQPWCSVPLRVDFKSGHSWGAMKESKHDE